MNRRSFGLKALATVAGIAGLSAAKVSLTEAHEASGPVADICADYRDLETLSRPGYTFSTFDQCVHEYCRYECRRTNGTCYGYDDYKACVRANS